jgi:hypothetical protein
VFGSTVARALPDRPPTARRWVHRRRYKHLPINCRPRCVGCALAGVRLRCAVRVDETRGGVDAPALLASLLWRTMASHPCRAAFARSAAVISASPSPGPLWYMVTVPTSTWARVGGSVSTSTASSSFEVIACGGGLTSSYFVLMAHADRARSEAFRPRLRTAPTDLPSRSGATALTPDADSSSDDRPSTAFSRRTSSRRAVRHRREDSRRPPRGACVSARPA